MTYTYTQLWFHPNIALKTELPKYVDVNKKLNILEIGNFEGLSACFFSDYFLNHPNSKLYCVDPYYHTGSVSGITCQCIDANTEKIFNENIRKSKHYKKIYKNKMTSSKFFENNNEVFDIIYIDGCHEPNYIKADIHGSFESVTKNSIIWMDDYGGITTSDGPIKNHIDECLKIYRKRFKILYKGYQLGIQIL